LPTFNNWLLSMIVLSAIVSLDVDCKEVRQVPLWNYLEL
jgi:hypothetical protein